MFLTLDNGKEIPLTGRNRAVMKALLQVEDWASALAFAGEPLKTLEELHTLVKSVDSAQNLHDLGTSIRSMKRAIESAFPGWATAYLQATDAVRSQLRAEVEAALKEET